MPEPLVIAYHLVWTAYGCWLPNDPRGSGSHVVRSEHLAELGEPHFGRKRVQPTREHIRQFYENATPRLRHARHSFPHDDRRLVAEAFGEVIASEKYTCYACAVMPDHVHLLIRKHKHLAENRMDVLKVGSRDRLVASGRRTSDHPVWTVGGWKVFLHPDEITRTIGYIERNPIPLGEPVQAWPFVTAYDGWPLHPGHSPNSPYAQRLRR